MSKPEKTMVAIDGTDALAYVILRPGENASGVVIEAGANGISKAYAAYALRHTAQSWDPDDTVGADVGQQLKAAHAEIEKLKTELEAVEQQLDNLDRRPARDEHPTYCVECWGRRDLPRAAEGPCRCDARPA